MQKEQRRFSNQWGQNLIFFFRVNITGIFIFLYDEKGSRQKKRIFYSQADRKRLPPHPLRSVFCENLFGVFFILDYDSMCSKTDFTQEKVNFLIGWQ